MTDQADNTHNPTPANEPLALRLSEGLGPLPEYADKFRPRWFGDVGGFTGAQMRLYALDAVAAERARWAKMLHERLDDTVVIKYAAINGCAAARDALRNALADGLGA